GQTGGTGSGGGHGCSSLRFDDTDPGNEGSRPEPGHRFGFGVGAASSVTHEAISRLVEMVLGLGHDVGGVGEPGDAVVELAQIRGDQAIVGHGGAPTTRWTVSANVDHSRRFSRAAFLPGEVSV